MVSTDTGARYLRMADPPRGYGRLIPSHWQAHDNALLLISDHVGRPMPLGRAKHMEWGPIRDGYMTFGSDAPNADIASTATCWFRETGELWGVASNFFVDWHPYYYSPDVALEHWRTWLGRSLQVCTATGGLGPFHVILGLDGILGTRGSGPVSGPALQHDVFHAFAISNRDPVQIDKGMMELAEKVKRAYGFVPKPAPQRST